MEYFTLFLRLNNCSLFCLQRKTFVARISAEEYRLEGYTRHILRSF